MGSAKHIGRVGALAAALGVGNVRRTATRMTVSIGVAAAVVMATVVPASASSPGCKPTDARCALIMGFTSLPTPDKVYIDAVGNQFIAPTHPTQPGQEIGYVPVTTPEEGWPLTGLIRLGCAAVGAQSLCGPGGAAWPDEPWWKLSGLFDLTYDQSNEAGLADLEKAMAEHPSDHLVIYGYSQGATIANLEKQRLAEEYPAGTAPPDIDFVLGGDPNLPNGGLEARFPGLYIPFLNWSFNGPEPTDTQFDTAVITRQYDFIADFPLYPLNLFSDLNAILGFFYVHLNGFDVSLADDASAPAVSKDPTGKTSYYFFETQDLPLFGPLRTLGVPEEVIDVFEPFFKVIVDLGYDRSIKPWEPTPARLIPSLNPATVATDLVDAIGEGINNAATLVGLPPLLRIPAPVTLAVPASETAKPEVSQKVTATDTLTQTERVTSTGTAVVNTVTADPVSVTETVQTDVSRQVAPTETETETSHVTSTRKVIETAKAHEVSTGPRATLNPSVGASTPEPAKSAGQPAAPRPVVRGSLGVGEQLRDLPHRGNGGRRATRTSAAGDKAAMAGPSSVASTSAASSSTGGDSSGGDAGGS